MANDRSYALRQNFFREIRIEGDECVYCGTAKTELDHFIPQCVIKIFPVDNWLLPSCQECNQIAGSFLFKTFFHKMIFVRYATIGSIHVDLTFELQQIKLPTALLTRLKKVNQLQRPVKDIIRIPTFRRSGTWDTSQRVEYYIDCSDSYIGVSNIYQGKEQSA